MTRTLNPVETEIAAQVLASRGTPGDMTEALDLARRADRPSLETRAVMEDPRVQARAVEIVRTRFTAVGITAERTMTELARVAYSNAKDLFHLDGRLKAIHDMDDDTAATIVSVEVEDKPEVVAPPKRKVDKRFAGWEESDTEHPDFQPTVVISKVTKLKRADKMAALSIFAKHFKIVSNEDGGVDALAGVLADRLNAANRRANQRGSTPAEDARIIEPFGGLLQTADTQVQVQVPSTPPGPTRVIDSTEPAEPQAAAPAAPPAAPPVPPSTTTEPDDEPLW